MKQIYKYLIAISILAFASAPSSAQDAVTTNGVKISNIEMRQADDRLIVDMIMDMSELRIQSNRSLRITPTITNGQEMIQLPAVVIDGRRRHIVHKREGDLDTSIDSYIRRHNRREQVEEYGANLPFEGWMADSELILREEWCGCHDVPMSEDFIAIAEFTPPQTAPAQSVTQEQARAAYLMPEKKEETAPQRQSFKILFPLNKSQIDAAFMSNSSQIENLHTALEAGDIESINLMGYASPDGPYDFNRTLASHRAQAVQKHLELANLPSDVTITTNSSPTNWEALKSMLNEKKIDNWQQIVAIIDDSAIAPNQKNNTIRTRFPEQYATMLSGWYPQMRVADICINHKAEKELTANDVKRIAKENPQQLSLDDIYLVAIKYGRGSKQWDELILLAVESYPQSVEARINAANVAMANGNFSQAATYLQGIPDTIPEAANSQGILAMAEGRYGQAMVLFQKALSGGVSDAAYNISLLQKLMED